MLVDQYTHIYLACIRVKMIHIPYKFPINEHFECQLDHVPRGRPIILHHVQGHGNMGMTVVTTKVMLIQSKNQSISQS